MRAPRYIVAIRGDARTIKALFARGSQLTGGEGGQWRGRKKKESVPSIRRYTPPAVRRLYTDGDGNEDESKPFR